MRLGRTDKVAKRPEAQRKLSDQGTSTTLGPMFQLKDTLIETK